MNDLLKVASFLALLYLVSIVLQGGGKYLNFDISLVYDLRSASADNLNPIYSYISPIVGKVIVPLIIVISVIYKKWFYTILGVVFSVLIFGFTAHKSPLFYPLVIVSVYFLSKGNMSRYILLGCVCLVSISLVDFFLSDHDNGELAWLGSLFSRRAIMVPVLLNSYYVDFFMSNPVYYWSDSKFSFGLVESPYVLRSVNLIGDVYFSRSEMSANAGWIGSGFANASWFGAFIYSFFVGVVLSFFCAIGRKIGERFVFSSSLVVVIAVLQSTDLTTSLLTHGLLFLIIVYLVIPRGVLK
ncbi:hypothetical protein [Zobellella sp. An-6]|uniref:hypothetical protein n=1 Tax=Zobellella sp. An-6 TaxID=3400218 RepID=UPI004042E5DA